MLFRSRAVCGMRSELDTSSLDDGLLSPLLIASGRTFPLPKIKKRGDRIFPIYPSAEQFFALSEKERALRSRVCELEESVDKLTKKVFGEPLFEFPSADWLALHANQAKEDQK